MQLHTVPHLQATACCQRLQRIHVRQEVVSGRQHPQPPKLLHALHAARMFVRVHVWLAWQAACSPLVGAALRDAARKHQRKNSALNTTTAFYASSTQPPSPAGW
jgi:hypothetical protein